MNKVGLSYLINKDKKFGVCCVSYIPSFMEREFAKAFFKAGGGIGDKIKIADEFNIDKVIAFGDAELVDKFGWEISSSKIISKAINMLLRKIKIGNFEIASIYPLPLSNLGIEFSIHSIFPIIACEYFIDLYFDLKK